MNYHWARSVGAPREVHEHVIFWSLLGGGWFVGGQMWGVGARAPLGCLWVAPALSLVGWWLERE